MRAEINTRRKEILFLCILFMIGLISWSVSRTYWISKKEKSFALNYTSSDKKNIKTYSKLLRKGLADVQLFFNKPYTKPFQVYIHPDRHSLDSTWQQDWGMPGFKSECWMVASGTAAKLDMISPANWNKEACEHIYAEKDKTQQLITHELVHVFHGQLNASPDFSNTENIDWFVEGLATYASGQCDSSRIAEVIKTVAGDAIPQSLDDFWKGKIKYGLSGSVVMFIDAKYGRNKLTELLPFNKKSEILQRLGIDESQLLREWKAYMQKRK